MSPTTMGTGTIRTSAAGGEMRRFVSDLAGVVDELIKALFDPYRPELHYMRGPGPKWHAKHDRSAGCPPCGAVEAGVRTAFCTARPRPH